MDKNTERLKHDLQIMEKALGVNLWTRRDVRRAFLGVLSGGAAGLFLAIWCACDGPPETGLVLFLGMLMAILVAKGMGFKGQPTPAPGSQREIAFYNRFYGVGGVLTGAFYLWGVGRGMEPLTAFAATTVMAGTWYAFYALSAPSRQISAGGAVSLIACGFLLGAARSFSEALCWLGLAMCVGCGAEALLLFLALRLPPPPPSDSAAFGSRPVPASPSPVSPLPPICNAAH